MRVRGVVLLSWVHLRASVPYVDIYYMGESKQRPLVQQHQQQKETTELLSPGLHQSEKGATHPHQT